MPARALKSSDAIGGGLAGLPLGSSFARLARMALGLAMLAGMLAGIASAARADAAAEPEGYKTNDYRSPVPATLAGAKVVTTDAAKALYDAKAAVFIDVYPRPPKPPNLPAGTVWRDPRHASIMGAHWLPNVGYGVLAPAVESYFTSRLEALTGGDKSRPVVFFCLKNCWMSWNAAKRAMTYGYTAVTWFPDGTDGWEALGLSLAEAEAAP